MKYIVNATGRRMDNSIWQKCDVQFALDGESAVHPYADNRGIKKQSMAAWKRVLRVIDNEHQNGNHVAGIMVSGETNYCIGIAKQCMMSRINVFVPVTIPSPKNKRTGEYPFTPTGVRWVMPIRFAVERPAYYETSKMIIFSRYSPDLYKETIEKKARMDCTEWVTVADPHFRMENFQAEKEVRSYAAEVASILRKSGSAACFYNVPIETAMNLWVAMKNNSVPCYFVLRDWNADHTRKEPKRVEVIPF